MSGHPLLGNQYRFDEESGRFINAEHMRIAEIIHDYDPRLELAWIPPDQRDPVDVFPYVVIYNHPDGSRQAVFYLTEAELDHRVIARLFRNDTQRRGSETVWEEMQAEQLALDLLRKKKEQDELAEKWEFGIWALKTEKNQFKHNGKKYREGEPWPL